MTLPGWRLALLVPAVAVWAAPAGAAGREPGSAWCGTRAHAARDATWQHREAQARRGPHALAVGDRDVDVGEIAVLFDEGDLKLSAHPVDLAGTGVRFVPAGAGYRLERNDAPPRRAAGGRLELGDDDSREVELPFAFPFYGTDRTRVFVHSDGNLSFERPDAASTPRSLGRLLAGPPRVAPLFADFDPSVGGEVSSLASSEQFSVIWSGVPRFGETDRNDFAVTLYADGSIEFSYSERVSTGFDEAVAGIAPGAERDGLVSVDVSAGSGDQGDGALAEGFRAEDDIDTLAVARRFFASHPDAYAQLVVFTNRSLTPRGTFAYQQTVRNDAQGIGDDVFDVSAPFGSRGSLESFVLMDDLGKYPATPSLRFLGEDSSLGVLAHETGHRWLVHARFLDAGSPSGELLGRDGVHWSFFVDTDGSHLEGNDITDLGGGRFRTGGASERYSPLDLYLMGLRPPGEVPPLFFVREPSGAGSDPGRDPQTGIEFTGIRVDVGIDAIVAALGPREPPAGAPLVWRQAWVLVAVDGPPTQADIDKLERFRTQWEPFFERSTEGRARVTTTLAP